MARTALRQLLLGRAFSAKERFITDLEPQDRSFYLEVELKGLSSLSTGF